VVYGAVYVILLLAIASWIFARREFWEKQQNWLQSRKKHAKLENNIESRIGITNQLKICWNKN
jgi:hypothetical protein